VSITIGGFHSKTPSPISRTEMSKVPLPRS
jgi:hypothetical protein